MDKRAKNKEFITIKYYEIVETDISILVDSDIGFYHTFNPGDVITVEISNEIFKKKLRFGWVELVNPILYRKIGIEAYAFDIGLREFMIDITKKVDRNKKLEMLGI